MKLTSYPTTIYSTPEEWGRVTVYANADGIERTIEALKDAGGADWDNISIAECAQYSLINVCNDDTAAYRLSRSRYATEVTIFERGDETDTFELVDIFNTDHDAEELDALGVIL